mgnify:CR=1 FL=1
MAQGASVYSFRFNLVVTLALVVAMPVGGIYWGITGLLWATAIARATGLLALWPRAYRRGFLRLHREIVALLYLGLAYQLGLGVEGDDPYMLSIDELSDDGISALRAMVPVRRQILSDLVYVFVDGCSLRWESRTP